MSQVRFDVAGIFPGATVAHRLDLNANNGPLTLTTTAVRPSLLTTDTTNGLHFRIDECKGRTGSGWTQRRDRAGGGYVCSGTLETVLSYRPIIQRGIALSNLDRSATAHLLVSVTLPDSANNAFQGLATTLQLTFTGQP